MDKRIKAQVSMEVLILMSFLFLVFIIFLGFMNSKLSAEHSEKESLFLKDISNQIQSEIRLAYNAKEGYLRNFTLPEKLENKIDYDIEISGNSLLTKTSKHQYVMTIPDITGAVIKGNNQIKKINKTIIIN